MKAMSMKVALVGHCGADTTYLRIAILSAGRDWRVIAVEDESSLQQALQHGIDLVLANRVLDWGFVEVDGVELIRRLRTTHPHVKTMLVSNYPDAQAAAVQAGGLPGFGKRQIGTSEVTRILRDALHSTGTAGRAAVSNDHANQR